MIKWNQVSRCLCRFISNFLKESSFLHGSLWELVGWTRFSCKLCWYSMEQICWLNCYKSPRVQCIKWASNNHTAVRYGIDTDWSFQLLVVLTYFPIEIYRIISHQKQSLEWLIWIYGISGQQCYGLRLVWYLGPLVTHSNLAQKCVPHCISIIYSWI